MRVCLPLVLVLACSSEAGSPSGAASSPGPEKKPPPTAPDTPLKGPQTGAATGAETAPKLRHVNHQVAFQDAHTYTQKLGARHIRLPKTLSLGDAYEMRDAPDWFARRIENARSGRPELVRIPLARRSVGWGDYPDNYVGASPDTHEGLPWLTVTTARGHQLPTPTNRGYAVVAEGYFTGKRDIYEMELDEGKVDRLPLDGFHVLRSRPLDMEKDDQVTLLLDADELARSVPRFEDDRPYLVIAASIPFADPKAMARVDTKLAQLQKAGFEKASVFDFRSAPLLFCCFHVVAAGRYTTRDEAKKNLARLEATTGIAGYIRKGFQSPGN